MKIINLDYNPILQEYVIDYGPNHKNRRRLCGPDRKELIDSLKTEIDFKRNIELYLTPLVEQIVGNDIRDLFRETKVLVKIKKSLIDKI